jgi:hypothetical protein
MDILVYGGKDYICSGGLRFVDSVEEFNWQPRFNTLPQIIETAWKWHSTHPNGYDDK